MGRGRCSCKRLSRLVLAFMLGAAAIFATPVSRVAANTLVVTNTNDNGPGSLRQAIGDASSGDTITFHPNLHGGTIRLKENGGASSFTLYVTKALSIIGPGAHLLTISGNDAQQIFHIGVGDQDRVTISGLTLTGGHAKSCTFEYCYHSGGAIMVASGIVTLTSLVITANRAEGGGAGLLVEPHTYGDPPNIVQRNADVTLVDSVIRDNHAGANGGGIRMVGGKLTIERSAITGNSTDQSAGGILASGFFAPATVTIRNTTISGNQAKFSGGGLGINAPDVTVDIASSTIVRNIADADTNGSGFGGGVSIFSYDQVTHANVRNSLIVGNQAPDGNGPDCSGPVNSLGHNLWGTALDCPVNGPGDLTLAGLGVGVGAVLDPTLALNAPGGTPTHALVPGSPAIGAAEGGANCPAADQRGVPRPQGGGCDIGAYEFAALHNVSLTTTGPGSASATPGGPYASGQQATLTAAWDAASAIFAGWSVDGQLVGWANPLILPIAGQSRAVTAMFVARSGFGDVGSGRADYRAITELASRGTILGYGNGRYGPDDGVQRAQMAALIARATPLGPGTPPKTLAPPACIVGGTWDCEDWGNNFRDGGGLDPNLWRNVGTLQRYGVAYGYDGAGCAARNVPSPCFAPNEAVTYAQTISFITRAMQAKGFWTAQPGQAIPYAGVPTAHLSDVRTFHFYTQGQVGVPMPPANWNAQATRGWFALALWAALESYYSTNQVP